MVGLDAIDRLLADCLVPLAVWVLLSGADDLFLDLRYIIWRWAGNGPKHGHAQEPAEEKRIALLVPCWDEADVISRMVDRNLAAIEYDNYDAWIGVYPNDPATLAAVRELEQRWGKVHHIVCERPGPTTKADCLNQLERGIRRYEVESGNFYQLIVQHDAEDVIHPRSFQEMNRLSERFDMLQAGVLPWATPGQELTHGAYCDEFAEFHLKELPLRVATGGFMPSAGVGTAYRREALHRLRRMNRGQLFNPRSLTEDYFIGLQLHWLGGRQHFIDPRAGQDLMATRAYFPRGFRSAVRQRTRWVLGNCLQAWQGFGWRAGHRQHYWLWRDRKGLVGYPAALLANLVFLYGVATWLSASFTGTTWLFGGLLLAEPWLLALLGVNLTLFVWRLGVRMCTTGRAYGFMAASLVPLRVPWSNLINSVATLQAVTIYASARLKRHPLGWAKTTHSYPEATANTRRRLGEVLISMRLVEGRLVEEALEQQPADKRIGQMLLEAGSISEEDLFRALAAQSGLVFGRMEAGDIDRSVEDILDRPEWTEHRMMPFRLEGEGGLWLAGPEMPSQEFRSELKRSGFRSLRFLVITESNYEGLLRARETAARRSSIAAL